MSPWIPKHRIWPTIIIAVLVIDVAVGFVLMRVANSDPHAAVEPDYYQKAVDWDSTMAQARRNAALGWQVKPALGAISAAHDANLELGIVDGTGAMVRGAVVEVEAVQVAHAEEVVRGQLAEGGDSSGYSARLPFGRPGLWEVRIVATRGSDRYTADLRLDASRTGMAAVVTARPGDARPVSAVVVRRVAGS